MTQQQEKADEVILYWVSTGLGTPVVCRGLLGGGSFVLVSPHEPFLSCWVIWPQMGEIWTSVCRLLTFCKALRCGFVSHESTQLCCCFLSALPAGVGVLDGVWDMEFGISPLLGPCLHHCTGSVDGQGMGTSGEYLG